MVHFELSFFFSEFIFQSETSVIPKIVWLGSDYGYIDVGDECWRQNILMTTFRCC